MTVAYIAGPYRANTIRGIQQNIERASDVALKYWRRGYAVICPHKNAGLFDGACSDDIWVDGDIEILKRCDVIVMMAGWEDSRGACSERLAAIQNGLQVIDDNT